MNIIKKYRLGGQSGGSHVSEISASHGVYAMHGPETAIRQHQERQCPARDLHAAKNVKKFQDNGLDPENATATATAERSINEIYNIKS